MGAIIKVPVTVKRGEIFEVQVRIQHPMETGFRRNEEGRIPRNVISTVWCRYNGEEVFRADMSPGIAANPHLGFSAVADASGVIEISWVDEASQRGSERVSIVVSD